MDIEKPNCIGCHHMHPDNGNCTAVGGFCTAVPAAHCPLIPELRAELEASQATLAEQAKVAGGSVRTLFGVSLDRMQELAQAELEGRIVLRSAGAGKKCGNCGHWHRIRDTRRGTCEIRRWERDRYGTSNPGASFTPAQSYGACRDYIPVKTMGGDGAAAE